MYIHETLSCR